MSKIKLLFRKVFKLPLYVLAIPAVLIIRLIRPLLLVRIGGLWSNRIGHFTACTELYLLELKAGINEPIQRYVDLFYIGKPVCNQQLSLMWQRVLHIWPALILVPIYYVNRLIPGWKSHLISYVSERDIYNLYERYPPHLQFTNEEEKRGEADLRAMGIPEGAQFVCLNVRDRAYLDSYLPNNSNWNYQNYRDSDIQNYILAAEELAERGYFVIRMGAKVNAAINSDHPKVLDYSTNGMRSDFMDIYLGAKCLFAISTGTGWDGIPEIQQRPIVYVNYGPVGRIQTFRKLTMCIVKHHYSVEKNRELSISEIFTHGVGYCLDTSGYESKGVNLIENTPEEIRDVAIEMVERIEGTWQESRGDDSLQQRFWKLFPTDATDPSTCNPFHGDIHIKFGTSFLRNNPEWLN